MLLLVGKVRVQIHKILPPAWLKMPMIYRLLANYDKHAYQILSPLGGPLRISLIVIVFILIKAMSFNRAKEIDRLRASICRLIKTEKEIT